MGIPLGDGRGEDRGARNFICRYGTCRRDPQRARDMQNVRAALPLGAHRDIGRRLLFAFDTGARDAAPRRG